MTAAPPPMPTAIAFRDPAHGVLTTSTGFEVTSDGGRTWRVTTQRPSVVAERRGPPCTRTLFRGFASGRWMLCVGEDGAGAGGKAVYERMAHGWRRVAYTPFPPPGTGYGGIALYGYALGITMAPDGFGVIWESRGTLYLTHDGGSHWLAKPTVAAREVDFGISASALPHGVAFVLLVRNGVHRRLIETTDAGRSWHVVHRWG
jgi:hypothetical protein